MKSTILQEKKHLNFAIRKNKSIFDLIKTIKLITITCKLMRDY